MPAKLFDRQEAVRLVERWPSSSRDEPPFFDEGAPGPLGLSEDDPRRRWSASGCRPVAARTSTGRAVRLRTCRGRSAIVVGDGLAAGSAARAALRRVRHQ